MGHTLSHHSHGSLGRIPPKGLDLLVITFFLINFVLLEIEPLHIGLHPQPLTL